MSEDDPRVFARLGLQAAVAAAIADERRRLATIMRTPEAAGREKLALQLATTTSKTFDQVRAALAAAPLADGSGSVASEPAVSQPSAPTPVTPPAEPPTVDNATSTADAAAMWEKSMTARGLPMRAMPAAADTSALWDASLKSRGMTVGGRQ